MRKCEGCQRVIPDTEESFRFASGERFGKCCVSTVIDTASEETTTGYVDYVSVGRGLNMQQQKARGMV